MQDVTVSVVSVLLAVVALFVFATTTDDAVSGALLGLAIAVNVPYGYGEYWPVEYPPGAAAVWSVAAAFVTAGVFLGTYQLASGVLTGESIAAVAFVVTAVVQYGAAVLFARVRRGA